MLFNSIVFLVFFSVSLTLFFACPVRFRWIWLLGCSLFFYGYWKISYLGLMLFSIVVTHVCAVRVDRARTPTVKRSWLAACLIINFGILFAFKYYGFFAESVKGFGEMLGIGLEFPTLKVLLPVGISFYTFQAMGYLIDVYRGDLKAERNPGMFALYLTFFPQLVAGPIERSTRLLPQFSVQQEFRLENVLAGARFMALGFFMKCCISDRLSGYVDTVYGNVSAYTGGELVLATLLFGIQIYCDFAGYSTIAIGAARMFGIEIMQNFQRPYLARSIREFWSRWHVSLSTWFRDYLYVPLGGNRVSRARNSANLLLVFVISGLWHGANWTFIAWGGIHGFLLVAENLVARHKSLRERPSPWRVLPTMLAVFGAWVFFRAKDIGTAIEVFRGMTRGWQASPYYFGKVLLPFTSDSTSAAYFLITLLLIGGLASYELLEERKPGCLGRWAIKRPLLGSVGLGVFMGVIVLLGKFESTAFIYFQF